MRDKTIINALCPDNREVSRQITRTDKKKKKLNMKKHFCRLSKAEFIQAFSLRKKMQPFFIHLYGGSEFKQHQHLPRDSYNQKQGDSFPELYNPVCQYYKPLCCDLASNKLQTNKSVLPTGLPGSYFVVSPEHEITHTYTSVVLMEGKHKCETSLSEIHTSLVKSALTKVSRGGTKGVKILSLQNHTFWHYGHNY